MDDRDVLARLGSWWPRSTGWSADTPARDWTPTRPSSCNGEVALDQCWDLLRQRRARRAAGLDPEGAGVRPESTVESYLQ